MSNILKDLAVLLFSAGEELEKKASARDLTYTLKQWLNNYQLDLILRLTQENI